jgi:hypothetical protein
MGRHEITITLDAALVETLRAQGIDPAAYVEGLVRRAGHGGGPTDQHDWSDWAKRHGASIEAYNRRIQDEGLWCDEFRRF